MLQRSWRNGARRSGRKQPWRTGRFSANKHCDSSYYQSRETHVLTSNIQICIIDAHTFQTHNTASYPGQLFLLSCGLGLRLRCAASYPGQLFLLSCGLGLRLRCAASYPGQLFLLSCGLGLRLRCAASYPGQLFLLSCGLGLRLRCAASYPGQLFLLSCGLGLRLRRYAASYPAF